MSDAIINILVKLPNNSLNLNGTEEDAFINAIGDEIIAHIEKTTPSYDKLPMINGYFDKATSNFIEDEIPDIATGYADVTYVDFSDPNVKQPAAYKILKELFEDNPSTAEALFEVLSRKANDSATILGQFYAAVCDGQPYTPCKGCQADKSVDCLRCSRNKAIKDMYKEQPESHV